MKGAGFLKSQASETYKRKKRRGDFRGEKETSGGEGRKGLQKKKSGEKMGNIP